MGCNPPLRRAEFGQQAPHDLGGQFIKKPHPVIGGHFLHQLQHLAGAQPLQQGLLHRRIEVFVDLNGLILGQQPKGQGLQGARQAADRLGRIHLLHGAEQQLGTVVVASLQQGFQLLGDHLSHLYPVGLAHGPETPQC